MWVEIYLRMVDGRDIVPVQPYTLYYNLVLYVVFEHIVVNENYFWIYAILD